MFSEIVGLLALSGASAAASIQQRVFPASNVTVVSLDKTTNSTGGEGHVAIAGVLSPFGNIGAGCGVNWDDGVAYGGKTYRFKELGGRLNADWVGMQLASKQVQTLSASAADSRSPQQRWRSIQALVSTHRTPARTLLSLATRTALSH